MIHRSSNSHVTPLFHAIVVLLVMQPACANNDTAANNGQPLATTDTVADAADTEAADTEATGDSATQVDVGPVDAGPPPNPCGNGKIDPGEQCDGDKLGGKNCGDFNYPTGELGCSGKCVFDTSDCSPAKFGQRCGGPFPDCGAGLTCILFTEKGTDVGYCTKNCTVDGHCKGPPAGATCAFKVQGGKAICGFMCSPANPSCPDNLVCSKASDGDYHYCTTDKPAVCGDGELAPGEECDGADLDNLSCAAFGYDGGKLACNDKCKLEYAKCTGPHRCKDLPPRDCTEGNTACKKLELFTPFNHKDYIVTHGTKLSYLRHDTTMLVKYAAGSVNCMMPGRPPLGLGDMSMADGSTPKTSSGQLRHPKSTHDFGRDIDIAYYQLNTKDNKLRPVCKYTDNGKNAYHCVGEPVALDVPRSALFIAKLAASSRTRVIGVDGKIAPHLIKYLDHLANTNLIRKSVAKAAKSRLAYEVKNGGAGWYFHHHHHLHLSTFTKAYPPPPPPVDGSEMGAAAAARDKSWRWPIKRATRSNTMPPRIRAVADEWKDLR